jgi:hypothetical protein
MLRLGTGAAGGSSSVAAGAAAAATAAAATGGRHALESPALVVGDVGRLTRMVPTAAQPLADAIFKASATAAAGTIARRSTVEQYAGPLAGQLLEQKEGSMSSSRMASVGPSRRCTALEAAAAAVRVSQDYVAGGVVDAASIAAAATAAAAASAASGAGGARRVASAVMGSGARLADIADASRRRSSVSDTAGTWLLRDVQTVNAMMDALTLSKRGVAAAPSPGTHRRSSSLSSGGAGAAGAAAPAGQALRSEPAWRLSSSSGHALRRVTPQS